jgi:hypothetical protein
MNRTTPPAWATAIGGPFHRGPNPIVAISVLWALDAAGTYGATAREIANATGLEPRNVIGCLHNLRSRWGACYSRSDATGRWARHFAAFVKLDAAQAALDHWLAELAEQRAARAKLKGQSLRAKNRAVIQAEAAERAAHRAKVKAELEAARERRAGESKAAAQLRQAKANEAANNNRLAKRIKGTTQPSLAPVKHTNVTIIWPDDVKVTKCPAPVGRFELLQPCEGGLRSLPIGKYLEHASTWVNAATGADACAA